MYRTLAATFVIVSFHGGSALADPQPVLVPRVVEARRLPTPCPECTATVTVEFSLTTDGRVADPEVVHSEPQGLFDERAIRDVSDWRYRPHAAGDPAEDRKNLSRTLYFPIPNCSCRAEEPRAIPPDELIKPRPCLGVVIRELPPALVEAWGLPTSVGAIVSRVEEGSPAEEAGLKKADVIVRFNSQQVLEPEDFRAEIRRAQPGEGFEVVVLRNQEVVVMSGSLSTNTDRCR